LTAVLRRRLVDAKRGVGDGLPLWSSYGAAFEDILALWRGEVDEQALTDLIYGLSLIATGSSDEFIEALQWADQTPDLGTEAVWFGLDERAHVHLEAVEQHGQKVGEQELQAAFELPRVYHLLKLCFVGGTLPSRPVQGRTEGRSGDEPSPPVCLDVLTLLEAGHLAEAALTASRRLRARGYPSILREADLRALKMEPAQCRRLSGLLLVPVRRTGVLAALTIKPETRN
jgi:hypothetical protein